MSRQTLNLQDDWEEIKEAFRDHFSSENVEISEDMIKYSRNGEHLKIENNGEVSGAMPLHEASFSGVKEITFKQSGIELKSNEFSYSFRR